MTVYQDSLRNEDARGRLSPEYKAYIFCQEVMLELRKARAKFPVQNATTTALALAEEVGELARDVLQSQQEPNKYRGYAELRKEAVQAAVMAMRVAIDCGLDE